MEINQSE